MQTFDKHLKLLDEKAAKLKLQKIKAWSEFYKIRFIVVLIEELTKYGDCLKLAHSDKRRISYFEALQFPDSYNPLVLTERALEKGGSPRKGFRSKESTAKVVRLTVRKAYDYAYRQRLKAQHHKERSTRNEQIVEMDKEGLPQKVIAEKLGISTRTIQMVLKTEKAKHMNDEEVIEELKVAETPKQDPDTISEDEIGFEAPKVIEAPKVAEAPKPQMKPQRNLWSLPKLSDYLPKEIVLPLKPHFENFVNHGGSLDEIRKMTIDISYQPEEKRIDYFNDNFLPQILSW